MKADKREEAKMCDILGTVVPKSTIFRSSKSE